MMNHLNNWNEFVNLYDWEFDIMCDEQKHDVEFYKSVTESKKGDVLEIGCGTGRITRELVKIANSVTAVDNAPAFLEKLKINLKGTTNLEIVLSEMTALHLDKQYDTIIVSYSTFQYLLERSQQVTALTLFKKHLKAGGQLLIDISPCTALADSLNEFVPYYHHYHPHLDADVTMFTSYRIDQIQKIQFWTDKYIIKYRENSKKGHGIEEFVHHLALRRIEPEEMRELAELAGLRIVTIYGSYDKQEVTPDCNNWFFVLS